MKYIQSQKGFSLIDLLIGMTLSVLALTVMVNAVMIFDRQKKQTSSISDVQASGQIASYYLTRDLRMAGYGMTREAFTNCLVNGYDTSRATALSFNLTPVSITSGGGGLTSDTLTVFYGNSDITTTTSKLQAAVNGTNGNISLDNRYGFRPGDLSVLFNSGTDSNADGVPDCLLNEVTSIPGTSGQTNTIVRATGSYANGYTGVSASSKYNKSGGLGISYPSGTQAFNLGPNPALYTYSVIAGNILRRTNVLTGATQDLGDGIVSLKAYYIKDNDLNGVADALDQTTPVGADGWKKVLAIRYAIVSRSTTIEQDPITTITLVPAITLPNGTTIAAVTAPITGADRFYRYRVYGTTVALRNVIWRDS